VIYLAPDTNVLLHYTLFTEIDWPAVAEASDIILLFPATVIHELDARKYTGSDQRLQNRAQTVLRQIELAESNGPSNGSVAVAIAPAVPAAHSTSFTLIRYRQTTEFSANSLRFNACMESTFVS